MLNKILVYGLVAGLIAGGCLSAVVIAGPIGHGASGMAIGYLIMLVALSTVFIAIKRHRDEEGGGVIRFCPAFGLGIGISFVASLVYVFAWEMTVSLTHMDFAGSYAKALIAQRKAEGVSAGELARFTAEMESFKRQYANPLFRLPMTFAEIFPVGALVSLVSAGLLRNPRFLAARRS